MNASEAAYDLIKSFEGLFLRAYLCPAGVWTIGYGHTKNVKEGDTCTPTQADFWLRKDVEEAIAAVNQLITVPLTQSQFDALVSFTFNVGTGALKASTMRRLLMLRNYAAAAMQFERWNKAKGKVLPGLTRRRKEEKDLFLKEAPHDPGTVHSLA
jgi:lysozyme